MAVKIDYERFRPENIRPIMEPCQRQGCKSQNRVMFIEEAMIEAVKGLLLAGVNDLLGTLDEPVPMVNFNKNSTNDVLMPIISASPCEKTKKERLAHLEAYNVHITIPIRNSRDGFFYSWTYFCALSKVFTDNRTLGDIVDCTEITEGRIRPPVKKYNRDKWEVNYTLRATVDRTVYAGKWSGLC